MEENLDWVNKRLRDLESHELKAEEYKRAILEIYECLRLRAITPTFQRLVDNYKTEIK